MPRPSSLLAAALLAGSSVLASPAPTPVLARDDSTITSSYTLEPTDAWVSIGTDGTAEEIVTPVLTTIDGLATVVNPSPSTKPLLHTTSTTTEQPNAVATNGAGAFPLCHNTDGPYAPLCAPAAGSLLRPGRTYYVTWDQDFFGDAKTNTTVQIRGDLVDGGDNIFTSDDNIRATTMFYPWTVAKSILANVKNHASGVNVTITLSSSDGNQVTGQVVNVADPPIDNAPHKPAKGAALYIGLPVIFGFIVLMLAITCCWNQHRRRLQVGNDVMSRRRFGELSRPSVGLRRFGLGGRSQGYGIRKSKRQRVGALNLDSKDAIQLRGRNGDGDDEVDDVLYDHDYDDDRRDDTPGLSNANRARRDSDALGSLAGTPTDERFSQNQADGGQSSGPSGNVFRDELARQARE